MKKLLAIAVVAAMGVATSWADTTNVLSKQDITIKGKLSPSGTAVTGTDLSGNTNVISVLDLQIISGTETNEEQWMGKVVGSDFSLFLHEVATVDLTPNSTKGDKFVAVFAGDGQMGTSSNAVLLITGSSKVTVKSGVTNETVSGKITGVWVDGTDSGGGEAITGSFATAKVK
ncbi:MAG: hypothetical protein ABSH14_05635 [Verrucomicrobiia bacterium]|jgi:hypothetical protein